MSSKLSRSILEQPKMTLDTASLFAELDQFSAVFDGWWEGQMAEHSRRKKEFLAIEQRNGMEVAQLIRTKEAFECQERELDRQIAKQEKLLARLTSSLDKIKAEEAQLHAQLQTLASEKTARESTLASEKSRYTARLEQQQLQQHELTKGVAYYRERLGLEIRKSPKRKSALQLVFTQIDPADPQREFSIAFCLTDDNVYELLSCQPRLHGLRPLLDQLNASASAPNSLLQFVCAIRNRFRAETSTSAQSSQS